MIRASEQRTMQEFDFVSRVRLDISWESLMPVPSNLLSLLSNRWAYDTIWVPQMNRNGGIGDKFAVGTRRAMSTYLNRVHLFDNLDMTRLARRTTDMKKTPAKWVCGANLLRNCSKAEPCCWPAPLPKDGGVMPNCSKSKKGTCGLPNLNSERFLELTMWLAKNITVVHRQDWVFCKYGEIGHSWTGCTSRMRKQTPCTSLVCVAWSAGGCRCQNSTCARGYNPYCVDTLQTQLRLDGGILPHRSSGVSLSITNAEAGFPYHARSNAHRAVARTFLRASTRSAGRTGGWTATILGAGTAANKLTRKGGNATRLIKMAAKVAKRGGQANETIDAANGTVPLRKFAKRGVRGKVKGQLRNGSGAEAYSYGYR